MRTTLNLDDDVHALAKSLAEGRKTSLGEAVSYLARRGVTAQPTFTIRNGFAVFQVPEGSPKFGSEDIEAALEAEDREYARYFLDPKG
ncbi:MAG: antitoxin [Acidobacteriota bacterium]